MVIKKFNKRYIANFLVWAYLLLTPFLILSNFGMYDTKRILQLLLFLLLSIYFLYAAFRFKKYKARLIFSTPVLISLCLIIGLGILSSVVSGFPRYAFIEVVMLSTIIISCVLFAEKTLVGHYRLGMAIYITAISFSSVYLIYFFGNYISAHLNPLVPMWPERISVVIKMEDVTLTGKEVLKFFHKRFFNHIQTWTLPLLIASCVFFKSKRVYQNILIGLALCWWTLVFAAGARGTLVSVLLACFIVFILYRKRSFHFLWLSVVTAIGGFLLYLLMYKFFSPDTSLPIISDSIPVARTSATGRVEMWTKAFDMWISNPILGAGPMHYAVVETTPYFAHPHNFYLQFLSEWGTITFLCFLILPISYLLFIKQTFLKKNFESKELSHRNDTVYIGFICSIVAGFGHAALSGVFHTPMSQIWAILIISWFISLWHRNSNFKMTILLNRRYLSVLYFFIVTVLILLASFDISELTNDHSGYQERFEQKEFYPRFWEQGLIYEEDPSGGSTTGQNSTGARNSPGD